MSDIKNLDVMLVNFHGDDQVRDENVSETEFDSESRRRQKRTNMIEGNFRTLLNTKVSENSEITAAIIRQLVQKFLHRNFL